MPKEQVRPILRHGMLDPKSPAGSIDSSRQKTCCDSKHVSLSEGNIH